MSYYSIDAKTWRSPNYDARTKPISSIVVHSCEGQWPAPRSTSLPWLCNAASGVSAHYYVCRNTEIFQLVDDANVAWHAGEAQPAYQNAVSIGIECEHRAGQNWPVEQKDALAWLVRWVSEIHHIARDHIETHGQIAIKGPYKRKLDPTNWPHADFVQWRDAIYPPATRAYVARGLPVYQRSDRTGPLWGYLAPGEVVAIDDLSNGHIADGRGFVDVNGLQVQ